MPAFLIEWLAKSALMQSPVGALLKAVPAWAWKALAIIALLVAAFLWHQHAAHKALNAAYAHGKADEAERVKKQALELKAKIDALTGKIATQERAKNEEANRRIAADAGDLRMQGPGRAICSRPPAAASGHDPSAAGPDAARPALPPADFAAVPWPWLVNRGQEHDQLLAEVKAWHSWYDALVKVWPKQPSGG